MKPYSDRGNLNPDEVNFNFALSGIRVVVENAFGRLKVRFQCIAKRIDTSLEHTINIVTTCCILHNFCILSNQRFLGAVYMESSNSAKRVSSLIRLFIKASHGFIWFISNSPRLTE